MTRNECIINSSSKDIQFDLVTSIYKPVGGIKLAHI